MPLICLLMCDIQSVWSMILIPSVSEEQLLPPDGQCSWQQYRIGYDLYFTWTVYYSIYATLTYIYTLSEKVLFEWPYLCSHRCPFSCQWTYNEEGCLYIHALDKCELPADVYICIYCYWCIFCTCVHIYMGDLQVQDAWSEWRTETRRTFMNNRTSDQWWTICLKWEPTDEILIAVNICWQKKYILCC